MTEAEHAIFQAALALPPLSRAQLADLLWESLPEKQVDVSLDEEVRSAWVEESQRRMKEVDEGEVELIPGELVVERLTCRRGYGLGRPRTWQ